jgi:4-oxalocrotonate tautomerase
MPILEVKMLEGRSDDQKRRLVKELTEVICRTIDSKPEKVRIHLNEMPKNNYAIGGVLESDKKS